MGKFNTRTRAIRRPSSPVQVATVPTGRTAQGAPGYAVEPKGQLFLLGLTNMVSEDSFHEKAYQRDERFESLIHQVAVADPVWTKEFLGWLRNSANMRSASIVGALEAAKAMIDAKIPGSRAIVNWALQRSDEPGEAIAYWMAKYGRKMPIAVKRGIADAVIRLWNEFQLMKYDTVSHAMRFADVLSLTHPGDRRGSGQYHLKGPWQHDLFSYAIARRYNGDPEIPESLTMIHANKRLRASVNEDSRILTNTEALRAAGMTWEDTLSLAGNRVNKRELWEALIPLMSIGALIKNLRNFDDAQISETVAEKVVARLKDAGQIARSRQLPFRFLSAYRHARHIRWGHALEVALGHSVSNVPELPGRTLILVDRSGSMFNHVSAKTELTYADTAAIFGAALALKNIGRVDLVQFGSSSAQVTVRPSESVLMIVNQRFGSLGGTNTAAAARHWYQGHDRVIIITDEQSHDGDPGAVIPGHVPVYTWRLDQAKYSSMAGNSNRYLMGGLTDHSFKMIQTIEVRDGRASWPWEQQVG